MEIIKKKVSLPFPIPFSFDSNWNGTTVHCWPHHQTKAENGYPYHLKIYKGEDDNEQMGHIVMSYMGN